VQAGRDEHVPQGGRREVAPVPDVAVERRHRTAGHGDDQAASRREVRACVREQQVRFVDVLQHLGAHGVRGPARHAGGRLGRPQQIALLEPGAGDLGPRHLDTEPAVVDSPQLGVGMRPAQLGDQVSVAAADVQDSGSRTGGEQG